MTVARLLGLRWEFIPQLSCFVDDRSEGGIHGPAGAVETQIANQAHGYLQKACILSGREEVYIVPSNYMCQLLNIKR